MAVILRKKMAFRGGDPEEVKAFYPRGILSKAAREQAERLDEALREGMPEVAKNLATQKNKSALQKWWRFGKELRKILGKHASPTDIKEGYIWEAVRQHLPEDFPLEDAGVVRDQGLRRRDRDHFLPCYLLAEFKWDEVKWLRRWNDWRSLSRRVGILKDKRVFRCLGLEVGDLEGYPTGEGFEKILVHMAEEFPQRSDHKVDSAVLTDSEIKKKVHKAVKSVVKKPLAKS